ncbi:hypothetical protein [Streptococcus dysgalactiae]|uniref:hypothetical protein n=1 Tax=Streptococcus dysgalactiae TaxID=1334 RepID=UPI00186795B9|nr:hypothetical protein [Streptococcus dysgalactiae]
MKLNRLFILECLSASTFALGNLSSTSVHADTWQPLTSQLQEVTPGKNVQNEDPSLWAVSGKDAQNEDPSLWAVPGKDAQNEDPSLWAVSGKDAQNEDPSLP